MQNEFLGTLPAFYSGFEAFSFDEPEQVLTIPLEVFDFTFLHFHDFLEIGYCVDGYGVCCVEDVEYPFKAGDVQIIFPFQRHLSKNRDDQCSHWRWINIDPYTLLEQSGFAGVVRTAHLVREEMGLCGIFTPEEHPVIVEAVCRFFDEATRPRGTRYYKEACAATLYQLFICLSRESESLPKLPLAGANKIDFLKPVIDAISVGIQEGDVPSIHQLSTLCRMSVSAFRKDFQALIGLSPKEYILKAQIRAAENLLLTGDKSVAEISSEIGFHDISAFNRNFRAKTHLSPSEFRKQFCKK